MLIILRLSQTGVFNQFGQSRPVKMTRLGEPLENAAAVIGTHTVDYQVEQLLIQDPEYIKYQVLLDQLSLQQEKDKEKDHDKDMIPSNSKKQSTASQLKQQLFQQELRMNERRQVYQKEVLCNAEIIITTLSSAGKASFLDYMITAQVLFPYVIIDEAAQTTEPSTLIPLKCGCTHDN